MYKIALYSKILFRSLILLLFFACSKSGETVDPIVIPTNITLTTTILGADNENPYGDGSGKINISVTANNATSYKFEFGNGDEQTQSSGYLSYTYTTLGTQNYTLKVTASNADGVLSTSKQITVLYDPFLAIKKLLASNTSKIWYWDQTKTGHLGESPISSFQPTTYIATPNELQSVGCLYDDIMTFTQESNGEITFTLNNNGNTYFNEDKVMDALGSSNPSQDACYNFSTNSSKTLTFSEAESGILNSTKVNFTIENDGFMSYYLGTSTYEILSLTETEMYVRVIQDVNGVKSAWYHKFTTTEPPEIIDFSQLIWSDEFTTLITSNWNYDIGTGSSGWGNNELQYYTNRSDNVKVENGKLIITAKKNPMEEWTIPQQDYYLKINFHLNTDVLKYLQSSPEE